MLDEKPVPVANRAQRRVVEPFDRIGEAVAAEFARRERARGVAPREVVVCRAPGRSALRGGDVEDIAKDREIDGAACSPSY